MREAWGWWTGCKLAALKSQRVWVSKLMREKGWVARGRETGPGEATGVSPRRRGWSERCWLRTDGRKEDAGCRALKVNVGFDQGDEGLIQA